MKAWVLIITVLGVWFFGIGLGSVMRIERKISNGTLVKIFFFSPLFAFEGFIIWTVYTIHDIIVDRKTRIRFIIFMYRSYFKIMPYMCEAFTSVIINSDKERKRSGKSTAQNTKHIFQRGYDLALAEGYM